jgi:hypothetical protein
MQTKRYKKKGVSNVANTFSYQRYILRELNKNRASFYSIIQLYMGYVAHLSYLNEGIFSCSSY